MTIFRFFFEHKIVRRFWKNLLGVVSFFVIILIVFLALSAYILAPDKTENANWGDLSIKSKPPGFEVMVLDIPLKDIPQFRFSEYLWGRKIRSEKHYIRSYKIQDNKLLYEEYHEDPDISLWREATLGQFRKQTHWQEIIDEHIYTQRFWLGTDKSGRDYLSRMLVGARVSLAVGFVAVFISLLVGILLGGLAGYFGGKTDDFIMWLINVVWSVPTLLLVIAITMALGKGFWQVFLAVGLTMWVEVARVVRGQVVGIKKLQYVTAAKALGYSHYRILTKHILPAVWAPVIVISAANFASAILVESGLSFLGLGVQPPTPSWGGMIKESYSDIILGKPYLTLIPGGAILVLTLSFMLVGNALRDALDIKK